MRESEMELKEAELAEHEEVTVEQVRLGLHELVNRVGYGRERIVITRHGKPVAALVSLDDLEALNKAAA